MKRTFLLLCLALTGMAAFAQDIIVTAKAERIEALITEVSPTEIRYKKWNYQDGPTFVVAIADLSAVIFKNGEVQVFGKKGNATTRQSAAAGQPTAAGSVQRNLASADQISGVYVFSDCKPVGAYDVLGTVNFAGGEKTSAMAMPVTHYHNGQVTTHVVPTTVTEEPQYTSIRNGLVTNAILANQQVEGVILSIEGEGIGKATMIKFKDGVENKNHALVNCYSGIYVFNDCTPLYPYSYIGKTGFTLGLSSSYTYLRDKLLKKCRQSYKNENVQGLIVHLKEGGKDTAEAIRFQ